MKPHLLRITAAICLMTLIVSCDKNETEVKVHRISYGVPTITITTEGKVDVVTKTDHIPCTIKAIDDGASSPYLIASGKIHLRGNATSGYPKKPYKIKLDEKASFCGFPENRDWVLLAMYCDHSLLRECYLHKLSEKAGMPYTIRHQHVVLVLNGENLGTYLLTEQVEKAKDRVNVDDNGFIIEKDNYAQGEPLWVPTARGHNFTFKYPDAGDGDIVSGDAEYNFIKDFLDRFESAVYSSNFDPNTGYRKYIDVRTWAKWFLVHELAGNIDTNHYFAMKNHSSKLEPYPVWDAEWSFGLAASGSNGWATPGKVEPLVNGSYWANATYFRNVIKDPYFISILKDEWYKLKKQMPDIHREMEELAASIQKAQAYNFKVWPILNEYTSVGIVKFGNWKDEVKYVDDFLTAHAKWFDEWISTK